MDFDPNEDFDFGAAPDIDEIGNNGGLDEHYDENNDETFGGEIGDVPADFSDFAANSLAVELETVKFVDNNVAPSSSKSPAAPSPAIHRPPGFYGAPGQPVPPHIGGVNTGLPPPLSHISHGHNFPPGFPFAQPPGLPPLSPMYVQQQWTQYQRMTLATMAANNVAPENISPLLHSAVPPPPFIAYLMSQNALHKTPPSTYSPVPPMMGHAPPPRHENETPVNPRPYPASGFPNNFMPHSQSNCPSPGSTTSKKNRKDGMPSLRTISDFAFDPFAGFMSKKEREWLIKIQLIQCLGTGDKYVDDYYYTMWRQSNELEKRPDEWKQAKIQSKYYNLEETYPSANYTPPSFSGALGKPSHATTSFPRQCFKMLDFQPTEEDDESVVGGPTRDNKRKLRIILLAIENAYLSLLEIDDHRRKLHLDPSHAHGITEKLSLIYSMILDEDHIPTTMVVSKGRSLIARVLLIAPGNMVVHIMANVFNTLRKYSKKVSNSDYGEFVQAALKAFTEADIEDLIRFFEITVADRFKDTLVYSSFSQNLLTALLIACARKNVRFEGEVGKTSIIEFLNTERRMFSGLGTNFNVLFSHEDLIVFKHWLASLKIHSAGNLVDNLLNCVTTKIRDFTIF